jgi:hypothetical protein
LFGAPGVVIFPLEPPVALAPMAEGPAAVKGAPAFGAAQRTLDGEDHSATSVWPAGGSGGKITFPLVGSELVSKPLR